MADLILKRPAVQARTGLSRSTIYLMMAQGAFPKPITLGAPRAGDSIILNGFVTLPERVKNIRLLSGQKLDWKNNGASICVTAPATDERLSLVLVVELE